MLTKNRLWFNQKLRRFLWSKEVAPFIDELECGWLDGGCYTCAMSLYCYLLLSQSIDPTDLSLEILADQDRPADHVVAHVRQGDTHWYLDANGIQSERQLMRYWTKKEGCINPWLRAYNASLLLQSYIPLHQDISVRLSGLLWTTFGPFSLDWLE